MGRRRADPNSRAERDRCPECGRLRLETAAAKFRRTILGHLPPERRAQVGQLLNLADEIGREPAAVLLLGFDVLVKELAAAGVDVTFWTDAPPA